MNLIKQLKNKQYSRVRVLTRYEGTKKVAVTITATSPKGRPIVIKKGTSYVD